MVAGRYIAATPPLHYREKQKRENYEHTGGVYMDANELYPHRQSSQNYTRSLPTSGPPKVQQPLYSVKVWLQKPRRTLEREMHEAPDELGGKNHNNQNKQGIQQNISRPKIWVILL